MLGILQIQTWKLKIKELGSILHTVLESIPEPPLPFVDGAPCRPLDSFRQHLDNR